MKVIDTHAHFWDPGRFEYPWIEPGTFFSRSFLLSDYQQASEGTPIDKMVFVECDCSPMHSIEEVEWAQQYASADTRIRGIVAHVHLTDEQQVDPNLEKLASIPLVRGVRHNIQSTPPGFALQDAFVRGVKKVHQKNMHFELCITHDQMGEAIELIKRCPEGQFVLDHCGKPGIKAGIKEPWMSQMKQMAGFDNVVCKISGLLTEADWKTWTPEDILPYAAHAAETFGVPRVMFGSDWPVSEAAGGFSKWYGLTLALTNSWSDSEKNDFYYNNANSFYRL